MLILVPSHVGSGIDQKTDSVLEFMYGTIELWHYFIHVRLYLVTGIILVTGIMLGNKYYDLHIAHFRLL